VSNDNNTASAERCRAYATRARELAQENPHAAGHYNGVANEWADAAKTFESRQD
jgi:hypothetical protein